MKKIIFLVALLLLIPAVFAQTNVFSDSFNRPDSGTVGNDWIEEETYGDIEIISNELEIDNSLQGDPGPYILQDGNWETTDDNITLSMKIKYTESTSGKNTFYMRLKTADDSNTFMFAADWHYSNNWEYVINGTSHEISTSFSEGTWYDLQMVFDLSADTVKFYIDGSLKGTQTINSGLSSFDYLQIQGGADEYGYKIYADDIFILEGGVSAANGVNITEPTNTTYFETGNNKSVDVEFSAAEDSRIIFADDYDLNLFVDNLTFYAPFETTHGNISYDYSGNSNDGVIYDSDLVGYWGFDEGTGTDAFDYSGEDNTGTLTNSPTWTTGKYGNALKFDGTASDQRVEVPVDSSFNNTNEISIGLWLNAGDNSADGSPTNRNLAFGGTGLIYSEHTEKIYAFLVNETENEWANPYLGEQTLEDWGWMHLMMTWKSLDAGGDGKIRLYRDGELWFTDSDVMSGNSQMTTSNFWIGSDDGGRHFNGTIDEVKIYDRALSEDEISDVYNYGIGTSGKYGDALKFDGENDYIEVGDDSSLDIDNEITISAWIKTTNDGNYKKIITKMDSSNNNGYWLQVNNDGRMHGLIKNGGTSLISLFSTETVYDDSWHHVVFTYDSSDGNAYMYIDGSEDGSDSSGTDIGTNNVPLYLSGHVEKAEHYFNGTIDEVMIFDRALSSTEIDILYENSRYMTEGTTYSTSFADKELGHRFVSLFDTNQTGHVTHVQDVYYTISDSVIVSCDASNTVKTLNFTYFNEENTTQNLRADIDINVVINEKNYSFSFDDQNSTVICICDGEDCEGFTADMDVKYDAQHVNSTSDVITDFTTRWYILKNIELTNSSRNITLYSLSEDDSINMRFDVVDTTKSALVGKIVRIQRYYPETDEYKVIAMGYTDDNGYTSIPLHFYDSYYRILVTDASGNIEKTSNKGIFYTSPHEVVVGDAPQLNVWGDIVTTCSYDNTLDNLVCDVTDTSGLMSSSNFYVREQRTVSHEKICIQTATTSSATYNCTLPDVENRSYSFYIGIIDSDGYEKQVDGGTIEGLTIGSKIYGDTGYYLAFLILLAFVFLGSFMPTASIIMGVFAFLMIDMLELIPIGDAAIFGLVLVGAILIVKLWRDMS